MKVIVDTNILISAILFPNGKVAEVFSYLIKTHDLIISSYAIEECEKVFKTKFPMKMNCLKEFFVDLSYELFQTPSKIDSKEYPEIRDAKDLPILASAIESDADILITGDKHFDDMKIHRPLIFTPNQYYELIGR